MKTLLDGLSMRVVRSKLEAPAWSLEKARILSVKRRQVRGLLYFVLFYVVFCKPKQKTKTAVGALLNLGFM